MQTPREDWEKWFQDVWAYREDTVYREMFGEFGPQIHNIPQVLFERMGFQQVDARWLVHGVFVSAPNQKHASWVYVTSAMSNPWGDDPATIDVTKPSGLGFELIMETAQDESWPIQVLHWLMAIQILAATGNVKGDLVEVHDRVPLHTSIDPQIESALRNLLICEPEAFPQEFTLPSGKVELLECVGMTEEENAFASEYGAEALIAKLRDSGGYPVTDAGRPSVIQN